MEWWQVALVVVVLALVGLAVWWALGRRRRSAGVESRREPLRARFGPEYDRLVAEVGDEAKAQEELLAREQRVSDMDLRPLSPESRQRYEAQWHRLQERFVDDPVGAVSSADLLVGDMMTERGYPTGDAEQRAADLSVGHAAVVDRYRTAHAIGARARTATTEELRQGIQHYRALAEELLSEDEPRPRGEVAGPPEPESPEQPEPPREPGATDAREVTDRPAAGVTDRPAADAAEEHRHEDGATGGHAEPHGSTAVSGDDERTIDVGRAEARDRDAPR